MTDEQILLISRWICSCPNRDVSVFHTMRRVDPLSGALTVSRLLVETPITVSPTLFPFRAMLVINTQRQIEIERMKEKERVRSKQIKGVSDGSEDKTFPQCVSGV